MKRPHDLVRSMAMALALLCYLNGCMPNSRGMHQQPLKPTITTQFAMEKIPLKFVSLTDGQIVEPEVFYSCHNPSDHLQAVLHKIETLQSPEWAWVFLFMQHAALHWLNEGLSTHNVIISSNGGMSQKGRPWFIADSQNIQLGMNTLALRHGKEVVEILPHENAEREVDWEPMNKENYQRRWSSMENSLHLCKLFTQEVD